MDVSATTILQYYCFEKSIGHRSCIYICILFFLFCLFESVLRGELKTLCSFAKKKRNNLATDKTVKSDDRYLYIYTVNKTSAVYT